MKKMIFFQLFKRLQSILSLPDLERWAATAWAIWNARNRYYFEQVQVHPRIIMEGATGLVDEYQRLMTAQV